VTGLTRAEEKVLANMLKPGDEMELLALVRLGVICRDTARTVKLMAEGGPALYSQCFCIMAMPDGRSVRLTVTAEEVPPGAGPGG
jgi:hypothetical protein